MKFVLFSMKLQNVHWYVLKGAQAFITQKSKRGTLKKRLLHLICTLNVLPEAVPNVESFCTDLVVDWLATAANGCV